MGDPLGAQPIRRQDSLAVDQAKIKYAETVNKKLKDPQKTIMLQLMEFGYMDYEKNYKVVKKEKKPDISVILDKINQQKWAKIVIYSIISFTQS